MKSIMYAFLSSGMMINEGSWVKHIHSSKKVTQHDFDRLYFYYLGFVFIKLDIPRKLVYLPFHALFVRIVSLGRVKGE